MRRILIVFVLIIVSLPGMAQIQQIDEADYLKAEELYAAAKASYAIGAYQESISGFSSAHRLNPNNSDYLFGRAMSYYELRKLDSATVDIENAIELAPNQPDYHLYAGNIYFKRRKYQQAIKNYQIAIKNQGNEDVFIDVVKAEFNVATSYLLSKSFENAVASYSRVIDQNEEFGDAYYNRAFAYWKLGKKDAACQNFKLALEKGVEKARAKINERCK